MKTCFSCKNFKLFTIKEMEQAFKLYQEVEEISIRSEVFIGRCQFFSKYPPWHSKSKYARRRVLHEIDVVEICGRIQKAERGEGYTGCVHYKHSRDDTKAQTEFSRRWRIARMILTENNQESEEYSFTLAELLKMKFPKPITDNFYCEGYAEWVYECPKNFVRSSTEKELRKPLGNICYVGAGWCDLTNKEIEEHRQGRKKYMYYGKNAIYNF